MIEGKKVLAIIPARAGSKRLPRKNILPLAGKPLISWTIEAALDSKYIDEIFVSTDDQEIVNIAKDSGILVPELRPKQLATDSARSVNVILYTLKNFGNDADIVLLLQPTSPLRTNVHIDEALELYSGKEALSVVSVTPCEHSPLWANTLPSDSSMINFIRPEALSRSQDLEQYYRLNGAIYAFDVDSLTKKQEIDYTENSYAYEMNNVSSVDIDEQLDFELASLIIEKNKND